MGGKDFVWNTVWQSVTVAFIYFGAFLLKQCHGYKPFPNAHWPFRAGTPETMLT